VWVYKKDYRGPEGVGGKQRGWSQAGKRGEIIAVSSRQPRVRLYLWLAEGVNPATG
jgi:hypothetical protein